MATHLQRLQKKSMALDRILALAGLVGLAFVLYTASQPTEQSEPDARLPALAVDLSRTTISGLSSGAYMAGQFQMAHAGIVKGAAIIAGGPYGCAESAFAGVVPGPGTVFLNASRAVNGCMLNSLSMWGVPNPEALAQKAKEMAESGVIGPISDVTSDRIYLFSGSEDDVVRPEIVRAAVAFYERLGVPKEQILFNQDVAAGHGFVTETKGGKCAETASPFIVDCDYDQAGRLLTHLIVGIKKPADAPSGSFKVFDQTTFTKDLDDHGMAESGALYVPPACRTADAGCAVHVAFHGCRQNRAAVGDAFMKDTGYARWADTNKLVILFPEVTQGPINPKGCWDWWGYTGRDYLTKDGPQIKAVRAMLERLAQAPASI